MSSQSTVRKLKKVAILGGPLPAPRQPLRARPCAPRGRRASVRRHATCQRSKAGRPRWPSRQPDVALVPGFCCQPVQILLDGGGRHGPSKWMDCSLAVVCCAPWQQLLQPRAAHGMGRKVALHGAWHACTCTQSVRLHTCTQRQAGRAPLTCAAFGPRPRPPSMMRSSSASTAPAMEPAGAAAAGRAAVLRGRQAGRGEAALVVGSRGLQNVRVPPQAWPANRLQLVCCSRPAASQPRTTHKPKPSSHKQRPRHSGQGAPASPHT